MPQPLFLEVLLVFLLVVWRPVVVKLGQEGCFISEQFFKVEIRLIRILLAVLILLGSKTSVIVLVAACWPKSLKDRSVPIPLRLPFLVAAACLLTELDRPDEDQDVGIVNCPRLAGILLHIWLLGNHLRLQLFVIRLSVWLPFGFVVILFLALLVVLVLFVVSVLLVVLVVVLIVPFVIFAARAGPLAPTTGHYHQEEHDAEQQLAVPHRFEPQQQISYRIIAVLYYICVIMPLTIRKQYFYRIGHQQSYLKIYALNVFNIQ